MNLMTVFLQAPAAAPGGGSMMWILLIAMFAIMYFFMIRPQNKKQKEIANFRKSLQVNQKVITAGGIHGVIKEINKMTRAKASDAACKYALMTLQNMAYIFGFDLSKKRLTLEERELMKAWEEARKAKDFKKADELRAQLQALNVL